ncbi:calpain-2 catalytic subunit-like [Poecilia formosa]|uniref:calpain-2 catalytic subunit-like n=1 Tax=Poecilia formosa TaxID=48698 RepID=UPI0007B805A4|nr:PREDICTED: calpain-2 catalytic subunit-like [Poecilia formosa]
MNVHLDRNFFVRHASAVRSETFINLREVCSRFVLPPGEYLIVPSTFEPNKDGDFCIQVFSEKQADFQVLEDPVESRVEKVRVLTWCAWLNRSKHRRCGRPIQTSVWTVGGTGEPVSDWPIGTAAVRWN